MNPAQASPSSPDPVLREITTDPNDISNTHNLLIERPFPEKKRSGFHFSITIIFTILFMVWAADLVDSYPTTDGKLKCAYALLNLTLVWMGLIYLPTPDYSSPLKYGYKLVLSMALVWSLNVMFVGFLVT